MTESATMAGTPAEAAEISPNGTALGFQVLAVAGIEASPTNPRKTFDPVKHEEMTESVRQLGVLQPILVRPHPTKRGKHELVAGERRWRAAKAAKLTTIPAIVKDLDDLTTLEVQVIENLQRDDLHPLEEAEGYEALMHKHAFTVEQLAAKVGKSRGYIYGRLKLCALSPEAREAFLAGTLDASTALVVARIPVPALQKQALKEIATGGEWLEEGGRGPMSYRRAAEHVRNRYMLRLDKAPFDVKAIYFAKNKAEAVAGPCAECPKRTGNAPDLFGDVDSADVCTDPQCFGEKRDAHGRQVAEEARAKGIEVLTGKDAKAVFPYAYSQPKGMVKLTDHNYSDEKNRTWAKILGKDAKDKVVLVESPEEPGTFVECIREKDVNAILKAKGIETRKKRASREELSPAERKQQRDHEVKRETGNRAYLALRDLVGAEGFTNAELRAIVLEAWDEGFDDLEFLALWGVEVSEDDSGIDKRVKEAVKAASGSTLLQMALDVLIGERRFAVSGNAVVQLAMERGVNVAAIEMDVREELKAKAGKKGKKAKAEENEEDEA